MKPTLVLGFLFLLLGQAPAQIPVPLEGTVQQVLLEHMSLKTAAGEITIIVLAPDTLVLRRTVTKLDGIRAGDWVGVDSKTAGDGTEVAVAVNIFDPATLPHLRKGQFPMASGDLMTNAPVDKLTVQGNAGKLDLNTAGTMVPIRVTADTKVFRSVRAQPEDLKPGTRVLARGTANPDGSVQAASVTLE